MPRKLNIPLPVNGLMVDRPAEFVDARAIVAGKNMEINRMVVRKRLGTAAVGSSLGERVQRYFELEVGNATRLFRIGLTKVEVLNKATGVWSSVAHAALTGLAENQISYAFPLLSGAKIAAYSNGVDAIRKCSISGNDAVLGGTPPKAKYLRAFGPYLVLANVIDGGNNYYSRVQWCDTGLPETWSGGNAGSQDLLEDPEDITGLGVFGGFLTVHKPNSIYLGQLVTTSDVFRFERKATGVGAASEASIQTLPSGEQIFLASDGLHLFNGITAPLIESPIQDELREEMNPLYLYKAQSVFVEELDEYWVCIATGSDTEPQTVYKYNWRTRQIRKDVRSNLVSMGVFVNTQEDTWADRTGQWNSDTSRWNSITNLSLNPVVIFGDSSGNSTKRTANSNNDNGVAVTANQDTKDFTAEDFGAKDMDLLMRWKGAEIWAKGSTVKIYYSTDGGTTWTLAETLSLGSDYPSDDAPLMAYFDVVSSRLRLRFENAVLGESFTLKKYQLEATPREARK
jgi:hypothetical protein